jgi:hypothetical protein
MAAMDPMIARSTMTRGCRSAIVVGVEKWLADLLDDSGEERQHKWAIGVDCTESHHRGRQLVDLS